MHINLSVLFFSLDSHLWIMIMVCRLLCCPQALCFRISRQTSFLLLVILLDYHATNVQFNKKYLLEKWRNLEFLGNNLKRKFVHIDREPNPTIKLFSIILLYYLRRIISIWFYTLANQVHYANQEIDFNFITHKGHYNFADRAKGKTH